MKNKPLLFHIMLKQGIAWFTLATSTQETIGITLQINDNIPNSFQMACVLKPECKFLHGYCRCLLPVETVDIKVKIKTMRGIHTFRRDRTTQVISCNPRSTRLCPYPSLIRKMRKYLDLEGKLGNSILPAEPTLTVATVTVTTQMPVTKSVATSIPLTVYNLAQGKFKGILNPTTRFQEGEGPSGPSNNSP